MIWIVLGILLLLWTIQFGFGIGGWILTALFVLVWLGSIVMLFVPGRGQ